MTLSCLSFTIEALIISNRLFSREPDLLQQ